MDESQPSPRPLTYAPRADGWRVGRQAVRWFAVLLLVAAGAALWRWHAPIAHGFAVLRAQRACLGYAAEPRQVLWYYDAGWRTADEPAAWAAGRPNIVASYLGGVRYVDPGWAELTWLASGQPTTTVLAGTLQAPNGQRRLIALDPKAGFTLVDETYGSLGVFVVVPGTFSRDPQSPEKNPAGPAAELQLQLKGCRPVRLSGPQADPNDPTHLTIDYDTTNGSGLIDIWLFDGDRVAVRDRGPVPSPVNRPAQPDTRPSDLLVPVANTPMSAEEAAGFQEFLNRRNRRPEDQWRDRKGERPGDPPPKDARPPIVH